MTSFMEWFAKPLQTPRLLLQKISFRDIDLINTLRADEAVVRYTGIVPYRARSEAATYVDRIAQSMAKGECIVWSISLNDSGQGIGTVCLWNFSEDKSAAEIGYDLLPRYWGMGYMTEAAQRVVAFGFDVLGFVKIFAELRAEHLRSRNLLVKTGFRFIKEYQETWADEEVLMRYYEIQKRQEPDGADHT